MFETFPKKFADYIDYCDRMTFLEKPDYEYLQNLFKGLMDKSGYQYDYNYDWINIDLE